MPAKVLIRLTGEVNDFELAERILLDYYEENCELPTLIEDSFRILGPENTIWLLESLALDKFIVLKEESVTTDEFHVA